MKVRKYIDGNGRKYKVMAGIGDKCLRPGARALINTVTLDGKATPGCRGAAPSTRLRQIWMRGHPREAGRCGRSDT